ncbi:hypothetical protein [Microbacterium indicum]|uniref:hypothetical protein n=1 Tax=Microbacterium indicum TaxID=358100 RepID=UPI00041C68B5|nr:hypothetical protein [Microbacterium indicum]
MTTPQIGLLLDVDGPIASTRTRTVRVPSIVPDLVAIARAGNPVIFNTGRSADFLGERVIPLLVDAGLPADAPVWGVGEKGGTWFELGGDVHQDDAMRPPQELFDAVRAIAGRHSDVMFFDETKRTMISIEHHVDVANEDFLAIRDDMAAEIQAHIERLGLVGTIDVYPTVISIDVEHRDSGKALGARRALRLIADRGLEAPRRWFTAGDSGQDYDMSTQLHELGFETTHLDVRPTGDARDEPYAVLREVPRFDEGVAEDDLTAAHLARIRADLGA